MGCPSCSDTIPGVPALLKVHHFASIQDLKPMKLGFFSSCRIPVNGDWNTISMPFANLLLDLNDFLVAKTWIRRPQKIVR